MYIAPADRTLGPEEWRPFVQSIGFGHLVAAGRNREFAVVVPTQFLLAEEVIYLHLVRANPIFEAIAEQPNVLLSVAGDWSYIPSDWKVIGDEDPMLGIPTTYYASVQLMGTATVVDERTEPGGVAAILRRQLTELQPEVAVADPAIAHAARLRTICGLAISVDQVRAKFKYGGNVDPEHRQGVLDRLVERDGPGDQAAAGHVARRIGHDPAHEG
jgi:transcriptional regulator